MSISFIVPCKNEAENIENTVNEIVKSVKNIYEYEIIIVNDASEDDTKNICKNLISNKNNIKLINNEKNLGYGGSFLHGLEFASKNYINLIPGDDAFPSEEIKKMTTNIKEYDLIISRPKEINDARELHRKLASKAFTLVVNFCFGYNLKYYNGIPLVKRDVINSINVKSKSPFFMAEIVLKVLKLKLSYDERDIFFRERKKGKSSIFNLKTIILTIIDLLKLRLNY